MAFDVLYSNSLRRGDLTYLANLAPTLLNELEAKAVAWAKQYRVEHGEPPSIERAMEERELRVYLVDDLRTIPLSDAYERAVNYMVQRRAQQVLSTLEAESDELGEYPVHKLVDLARELTVAKSTTVDTLTTFNHLGMWTCVDDGLKFGFATIDHDTGGILPGEMAVIAARPGVGKTLLACWLAVKHAREGGRPLVVSGEMRTPQLMTRIDGILGGFNPNVFRGMPSGVPNAVLQTRVNDGIAIIKAVGGDILFPKQAAPTINDVEGAVEALNPTLLIVDGIYLVQVITNNNRMAGWERTKEVSNRTKQLALGKGIPAIVTTQFRRNENERATLEDLAYSDAIAQDGDQVLGLSPVSVRAITMELIKNRYGQGGAVTQLTTDWETMTMVETPWTKTTVHLKKGDDDDA